MCASPHSSQKSQQRHHPGLPDRYRAIYYFPACNPCVAQGCCDDPHMQGHVWVQLIEQGDLLQNIERRDKYRKEIYDGDIVKVFDEFGENPNLFIA
jgi:hypothetical protein